MRCVILLIFCTCLLLSKKGRLHNGLLINLQIWALLELLLIAEGYSGAVVAPPWADPDLNPCAKQPSGWQLLFWPPDGGCYKIFQVCTKLLKPISFQQHSFALCDWFLPSKT